MAGAARIAEFFASVGFQADEKSLKSALTKVAAFGASVSVLAGGVLRMSISRGASKGLDGTKATGKGSMTRIAAWCGFPTTRTEPS